MSRWRLSRRECLQLGVLAGASLLTGCQRVWRPFVAPPVGSIPRDAALSEEVRWLHRVTFGATPAELQRLRQMGRVAYLEQQLHPDEEGEHLLLRWRWRSFEIFGATPAELGDLPVREVLRQLSQHAILRAVYSRYQLQERMVDFWRDHFNVYAHKGLCAYYLPQYERDVLRPHALGKFPDLLRAVARSPAMLLYLDNAQNRRGVPNENYARELLELHTLGVHGGYTQRDVQEVARCFTGWTVEEQFLRPRGTFRFDAAQHDDGQKQVLGQQLPAGGGIDDGERVLEMLALHPATARGLCRKLCVCFLGHAPGATVRRLSAVYLDTGGDIAAVLREMLLSEEAEHAPPVFKRPFDYLVSALRALHALTDGGQPLQEHLDKMGQPLYGWPMPDGYPQGEVAWKSTLLARWNFALALCSNAIRGTWVDLPALVGDRAASEALVEAVFCLPADAPALRRLRESLHGTFAQQAALILASPTFQWR